MGTVWWQSRGLGHGPSLSVLLIVCDKLEQDLSLVAANPGSESGLRMRRHMVLRGLMARKGEARGAGGLCTCRGDLTSKSGFSSQFLLSSMALLAGHGCFSKDDEDALLAQAQAGSSHFICALSAVGAPYLML